MAISTIYHYTIDLDKGGLREVLRNPLYTLNSKAHTFALEIKQGSAAANLSGANCKAYFIRADGVTVPIDGTVSGNVASVTLLPNCYAVQGRFELSVDLILGDVIHTVLHADGSLYRTRTDAMIAGGGPVQSFDELVSAVQKAFAGEIHTANGLLVDAVDDTTEGCGTATVILHPNGIAEIHYAVAIATSGIENNNFMWGLNAQLLQARNSNIPSITPCAGGTCVFWYNGSYSTSDNQYGGTHNTHSSGNAYWGFARVYTQEGDVGWWPSGKFAVGSNIVGTAFGTYVR